MLKRLNQLGERFDAHLAKLRLPFFDHLHYEASERLYWAEDDRRWGTDGTAWHGFWLLAFVGRVRDAICPNYDYKAIR